MFIPVYSAQLEEALTYKMQDETSMDRGLLHNSKKGLGRRNFSKFVDNTLTEEVAEETEDLKTTGNRSTHTRGGKLRYLFVPF